METLNNFSELKELLRNCYILQYLEFDDNNTCYFILNHVIPLFHDLDDETSIKLLDAKDGSSVHSLKKEKDFIGFTVEENEFLKEVTVNHTSNYYYKIFFKKL